MQWPTPEQIERYIKCADADLGPECVDAWVETIRHILRDIVTGRAAVTYGVLYAWGGGSGNKCKDICHWLIQPVAGDHITEKCSICGAIRSRPSGGTAGGQSGGGML
jgi:hypothetical protein